MTGPFSTHPLCLYNELSHCLTFRDLKCFHYKSKMTAILSESLILGSLLKLSRYLTY